MTGASANKNVESQEHRDRAAEDRPAGVSRKQPCQMAGGCKWLVMSGEGTPMTESKVKDNVCTYLDEPHGGERHGNELELE